MLAVQLVEDVPQVVMEVVGEEAGARVCRAQLTSAVETSEVPGEGGVEQTAAVSTLSLTSQQDSASLLASGGRGLAGVLAG